jgi:hypothetical protein
VVELPREPRGAHASDTRRVLARIHENPPSRKPKARDICRYRRERNKFRWPCQLDNDEVTEACASPLCSNGHTQRATAALH